MFEDVEVRMLKGGFCARLEDILKFIDLVNPDTALTKRIYHHGTSSSSREGRGKEVTRLLTLVCSLPSSTPACPYMGTRSFSRAALLCRVGTGFEDQIHLLRLRPPCIDERIA
jgi:hypothetical protein